jgi:uncharacterized integral membrane protein
MLSIMRRGLRSIDEAGVHKRRRTHKTSLIEAISTGAAYGAGLCGISALLVASFRPKDLSMPYWNRLPWLRTDTIGAVSLIVLSIALVISEYLRIRRAQRDVATPSTRLRQPLAVAVGRAIALVSTLIFIYISVNAVTHPVTLAIHATHFLSWPTEGALRIIALVLCVVSAGWLRYAAARSSALVEQPATGRAAH